MWLKLLSFMFEISFHGLREGNDLRRDKLSSYRVRLK
jgi:hypothetical protein